MQIISIKASKTKNQLWLTFSDQSFIPFFIDDVVKLNLIKNQEINDSKYHLIIQTCLQFIGREYALRQIAISPKTEKILNQKLKFFFKKAILKYQIKTHHQNLSEIIQQIIDELKAKKLLNDSDFINYFVKRNSKKSRQQVVYFLRQLGVNPDLLLKLEFNQESDIDKIKKFLEKKNIDKSKLTNFKEKSKLKASLFRRGFNLSDINDAIDDWLNFR